MKNMNDFKSFKGLKKGTSLVTEDVIQMGADFRVRGFDVPVQLINAFKKKAKDSGQDIAGKFADTELAEFIARYVQTTFLTIDNLPLEVLGTDYSNVQVQPQAQIIQDVPQDIPQDGQNVQAQTTAQEIPAQEGGAQGQVQIPQPGQGQIQGQGQPQGGQIQQI